MDHADSERKFVPYGNRRIGRLESKNQVNSSATFSLFPPNTLTGLCWLHSEC